MSTSERLAALARASSLLRSGLPSRRMLHEIVQIVPGIIPADAYAIWRHDDRQNFWYVAASAGLSDAFVHTIARGKRDDGVLLHGPFVVDIDTASLPAERRAVYEAEGIRQIFVLPLHIRGEATGTLACCYRVPREITTEDHQIGAVLGEIVSAAVSARSFDRFAEAARVVAGELDLPRIVQVVIDAATELTNAQFGAFEPTFTGTTTVRSANIRNDPSPPSAAHASVTSYLAVPVISRSGEVLGGLFFGHADEGVFTENEEQIVEALAAQAAVAIDNARLYTDLRHERERLARSEARYKSLLLAAPDARAIWIASAEGELIGGFESWQEITGQHADDTRGFGWSRAIHPDDAERVVQDWRRALDARTPMVRQFRIRTVDGSYRWFAVTAVPLVDDRGNVIEWAGTTVDVNEQTLAEQRLRFLAKASELLASSLDYETTLKTVAALAVPEIADWCAVDMVDEGGGPHRRLAVAHKDPAKIELAQELRRRFPPERSIDTVSRVIRTGKPEWMPYISPEIIRNAPISEEYRQALLTLEMVSFIVAPLNTRQGAIGAVTFVSSDSNRRFDEADLALAEELARRAAVAIENSRLYTAAQAANRAKDDFLATLSHELRTPMTAVLGWSRMLKMGLNETESADAIDAIERSATVQMELIEDILDMSRIMAGRMRIESVPVDLRAVVDAAITTVRPAAAAKDIEILTSFPPDLPSVLGDVARLQQVAWNLVTNAVKFTPRGGSVIVRITAVESTVSITVRDTGIGISRPFLPHVFEPFRQQDSSTTRAHGGIGLGLAIAHSVVELHGGRISAQSDGEGRGATFTVELPAMRDERRAVPAAKEDAMPSLDGVAVMVIDDQKPTRDIVAAILRRGGAQVACVESVPEAFEAMRERRPDVVVCDIAMPGEDGYEFVRRLREAGERIPVIALTAFGRPEDRENALASGFDAYLKKPVDPVRLATTVREMV